MALFFLVNLGRTNPKYWRERERERVTTGKLFNIAMENPRKCLIGKASLCEIVGGKNRRESVVSVWHDM